MKTNEIRITIKAPPDEVFEFTIEPKNTHLWIDTVDIQTVDTKQIGLGTKYTNRYGVLEVTDYDRNAFFELTDQKTGYRCSYSYRKIDSETTELVYFESMEDGSELIEPMNNRHFKKLQALLEK